LSKRTNLLAPESRRPNGGFLIALIGITGRITLRITEKTDTEMTDLVGHPHRFRLHTEQIEDRILSPRAVRSSQSRGRALFEDQDAVRTVFQRDRDRILHSKAFRRLKHKTQVFIDPEADHYRTRLTHTLEVAQIARTIARALRLNEDLTEAISLAHDLGHTPFGHGGEEAIDEALRSYLPNANFRHYDQSLRIVDALERNGQGLNLTWEVRDGIRGHSKGGKDLGIVQGTDIPETCEGMVVRIADRIAYLNHDIDDAVRANILDESDLPEEALEVLGHSHSQRIASMTLNVIVGSENSDEVKMTGHVLKATNILKDYMYKHVYLVDRRGNQEMAKAKKLLQQLFKLYLDEPRLAPQSMLGGYSVNNFNDLPLEDRAEHVTDFIAGMTDRYAAQKFRELFFPCAWTA
jgi:dGTPase